MERSTLDHWVGLFVVAGFAALTILALKVGNMGSFGGTETYQLTAPFSNIGGLKSRAAVKSAGVVVGRVSDNSFDNDNFVAKVSMHHEKRFNFPKDSSASLLPAGLAGEPSVGLDGGADEALLAVGDRVSMTP